MSLPLPMSLSLPLSLPLPLPDDFSQPLHLVACRCNCIGSCQKRMLGKSGRMFLHGSTTALLVAAAKTSPIVRECNWPTDNVHTHTHIMFPQFICSLGNGLGVWVWGVKMPACNTWIFSGLTKQAQVDKCGQRERKKGVQKLQITVRVRVGARSQDGHSACLFNSVWRAKQGPFSKSSTRFSSQANHCTIYNMLDLKMLD